MQFGEEEMSLPGSPSKCSSTTIQRYYHHPTLKQCARTPNAPLLKRIIAFAALSSLVLFLIHETTKHSTPPNRRIPGVEHAVQNFLLWAKDNPGTGAAAFVFIYGACVVFLLPGTPLVLGVGCAYKLAYGWAGGVAVAAFASIAGSLLGSVMCFFLGRYIVRDRVRRWGKRKYPLFDGIDAAVSENGFRFMCLLYLTPMLPLGPVSYMAGTTSMSMMSFAAARIAALPQVLLIVFIGASTDTFLSMESIGSNRTGEVESGEEGSGGGTEGSDDMRSGVNDEMHRVMVLFGLVTSIVSMSLLSLFVKKEVHKIVDRQKREKSEGEMDALNSNVEEQYGNVEVFSDMSEISHTRMHMITDSRGNIIP